MLFTWPAYMRGIDMHSYVTLSALNLVRKNTHLTVMDSSQLCRCLFQLTMNIYIHRPHVLSHRPVSLHIHACTGYLKNLVQIYEILIFLMYQEFKIC